MDFSVPGLLGAAKNFAKEFQNPLKDKATDVKELGEKLRKQIGNFIKRRLKKDVAKDLPTKFEHKGTIYERVMPDIQLERYKVEIELAKSKDIAPIESRNQILRSIHAIRDISDHPYLVDGQCVKHTTDELISSSAKLQVLCEILVEVKMKNEKVIVFADRKDTQKILQKVINDKFQIFPSIVNGDTPTTPKAENNSKLSRQQTIDRFQKEEGFNVIVMSPLAAGIGLNVTKANHVIHYSRHWNPAKEAQATDRAYRIGQVKDVHVYYPMAVFPSNMINKDGSKQKSFDEILDSLLNIKTSLATSTLYPTEMAEVKPDEIFKAVLDTKTDSKSKPLKIDQVDKLLPYLFEAFIAALYKAKGFNVILTPKSNDKGADVVAISKDECFLIQAKQSTSKIGNDAVQEIYGAKNYYEDKFKESFKLIVITNSEFSPSAITLADSNHVVLINRNQMIEFIESVTITNKDLHEIEDKRLEKI